MFSAKDLFSKGAGGLDIYGFSKRFHILYVEGDFVKRWLMLDVMNHDDR